MSHRSVSIASIFLCLILALPVVAADHHQKAEPEAAKSTGDFQSLIVRELDEVEQKVVALAEAVPQEKYAWRPADGVRSVAEAFMHVAQGNYFLVSLGGAAPPEGMNLMTYDKAATDKKDVVAALHASYDHARRFVKGMNEADLAKEIDFFGQKKTLRDLLMISVEHSHEHLGQAIAYARMNGVKPPWSQ